MNKDNGKVCVPKTRVKGGGTRRRTAYENPWARWLRWAAMIAVSMVSVSVSHGWVAGRWPKILNEYSYRREDSLINKKIGSKKLITYKRLLVEDVA